MPPATPKLQAHIRYDRQYGYLHTQSFASNVRDFSAYCRRMGGTESAIEKLKPYECK